MKHTFLKDLNSSLLECFSNNESVILIGEDILDPYGGAFKVTKGLSNKFPDRVIPAPISEASIVGFSIGAAMRGLLPVVELMFGDFITLATDQLINHAAKFPGMYNGKVNVPIVLRTPMGGYRGYGPTHSQSLEKHYLGIPGLRVVVPSHFISPGELLKTAILDDPMPVLFIEHKLLYPHEIGVDEENLTVETIKNSNELYPVVKVKNYKDYSDKSDIILISYGGTSRIVEEALIELRNEEIWTEAIYYTNIGAININPILDSIDEKSKVIFIEEGTEGYNWSSEIISKLVYRNSGISNIEFYQITAANSVVPSSIHMEHEMLPSKNDIFNKVMEVIEV